MAFLIDLLPGLIVAVAVLIVLRWQERQHKRELAELADLRRRLLADVAEDEQKLPRRWG
jgi:hypothetical protein